MIARLLLRLAERSLGAARSEWARAMDTELEYAAADGRALPFALGCVVAAWRDMRSHPDGRFTVVSHTLAIGLLIPVAAVQLACAAGLVHFQIGHAGLYALLTPGTPQQAYLDEAYRSARPVLLTLWLLLGMAQWRLAWVLLDRDWSRVVNTAALTLAASATLLIFTIVLLLDPTAAALQATVLIAELGAVSAAAWWHQQLPVFR